MIARCGEVRMKHWAHRGRRRCDPWWENETEWHRTWKDHFPSEWQEIGHTSPSGERHIADVKTARGRFIEFQHSRLVPAERRSREEFYNPLVWVVDGTRIARDRTQFMRAYRDGVPLVSGSLLRSVFTSESRLLREWSGSAVSVFVDFGEAPALWLVCPHSSSLSSYLHPVSRHDFIEWHRNPDSPSARQFDSFVYDLPREIARFELLRQRERSTSVGRGVRHDRRRFRF